MGAAVEGVVAAEAAACKRPRRPREAADVQQPRHPAAWEVGPVEPAAARPRQVAAAPAWTGLGVVPGAGGGGGDGGGDAKAGERAAARKREFIIVLYGSSRS